MASVSVFVSWREEAVERLRLTRAKEKVLQAWLEGYGLPPVDSYTEGNAWLLEAAREVPQFAQDLAPPATNLLQNYTNQTLKSEQLERLALNLFYLCAGLRNPPVFWQPLLDFLENRAVKSGIKPSDLGRYRGVPVVMAFRAALAESQGDRRLEGVWRRMLGERNAVPDDDKTFKFLKCLPIDGFEGVLGLPSDPNEVLIGWALARMADDLDDAPFKEKQFMGLLDRVKSRFNTASWNFELLAGRCEWKSWAQKIVGDPERLVSIKYVSAPRVEYFEDGDRSTVLIPEKYRRAASKSERLIYQLVLDFRLVKLRHDYLRSHIEYGMTHSTVDQETRFGFNPEYLISKIQACLHQAV